MKPAAHLFAATLLFATLLGPPISVTAQTAPPSSPMNQGPTTHVLAIGHFVSGVTREKVMPVMQQEVRDTVRLYLAGKIEQWYVRKDQNGVVFVLTIATIAEAHALLDKLPLGEGKLMEFDLIPLGPLTPLGLLVQDAGAPPAK